MHCIVTSASAGPHSIIGVHCSYIIRIDNFQIIVKSILENQII